MLRDLLLGAGQAQVAEPGQAGRQRHGLDFVDGLALAFAAARVLADQHVAASGRRREPPQSGQVLMLRYLPSSSRTVAESVSRQRRSRFGITPSKVWRLTVLRPFRSDRRRRSLRRPNRTAPSGARPRQFLERRFDLEFIVRRQAGEQRVGEGVAAVPTRIAPAARLSSGKATTRLGSKNPTCPMPSQLGQAPIGLLKLNSRGSSSGRLWLQTGQA